MYRLPELILFAKGSVAFATQCPFRRVALPAWPAVLGPDLTSHQGHMGRLSGTDIGYYYCQSFYLATPASPPPVG